VPQLLLGGQIKTAVQKWTEAFCSDVITVQKIISYSLILNI